VTKNDIEGGQASVLVELLRQMTPCFPRSRRRFCGLGEVYELRLANDRDSVTRVLPLGSGSLLKILVNCLREGCRWTDCKSLFLDEYFPYIFRERLFRDLISFNLHGLCENLREYIERISKAATFLQYQASEQKLVDRILMNFYPDILS